MQTQEKKTNLIRFRSWSRKNYAVFNSLHKVVSIGVLTATCSIAGQAQTSSKADYSGSEAQSLETLTEQSDTLEALVIEGTMNASTLFSSAINLAKIQQAAVRNTQDLLRYSQGVDLRSRGTEGVQADLSLKGGTFDQAQVFLDNANFTDPQTGHYSLNLPLNLTDIRAVRISEYNTGSVQFRSIHPSQTNAVFQLTGGQHNYYQLLGAGAAVNRKKQYVHLSASKTASDGYCYNTDFDIMNFYVKAFTPIKNGNINFQTGYQQKEYGANSFYSAAYKDQYDKTATFIALLQYQQDFGKLHNQTSVYYRRFHEVFQLFRDGVETPASYSGHNYHLSDVFGATSLFSYPTHAHGHTSLIIDYRNAHIYSSNLGKALPSPKNDPYSSRGVFGFSDMQEHISLSASHQIKYRKWGGDLKATVAGNSNFGTELYGYIRGIYNPSQELSLSVYAQNSFRVPTFTDLYYTSPTQQGNPDLNPEKFATTGLSVHWQPAQWKISVNPFYRYGFELIGWVRQPYETIWRAENLTNSQTMGTDISVAYTFSPHAWIKGLSANYIYLSQKSDGNGNLLSLYTTDYLRHQAKLSIEHKIFKRLSASWLFCLQDRMGTYLEHESKRETGYKAFIVCDLRLAWTDKYFTIFAEATNLFNTSYQELGNIPQAGIWTKAGVKLTLGQ